MKDTVVIDGDLLLSFEESAECELIIPESGEGGIYVAIHDGGGGIPYDGEYEVNPSFQTQVLETRERYMSDDVTVNAIEISRTSNPSGGTTVYIGGNVNG